MTQKINTIKAFCPVCQHEELEFSLVFNALEGTDWKILTCPQCGSFGYGYDSQEAYEDLIFRAKFTPICACIFNIGEKLKQTNSSLSIIAKALDNLADTYAEDNSPKYEDFDSAPNLTDLEKLKKFFTGSRGQNLED